MGLCGVLFALYAVWRRKYLRYIGAFIFVLFASLEDFSEAQTWAEASQQTAHRDFEESKILSKYVFDKFGSLYFLVSIGFCGGAEYEVVFLQR